MKNSLINLFKAKAKLPTLNITMLGPSGVGKTSLLAAMYDQFENVSRDLQLKADEDSKPILDQRLKQLKSLAGDSIKVRGGVESTNEPRSFKFEFGETGSPASLELNFQDYPGEYIEQADTSKRAEVKNFIRESSVVLIPIDTPALIEKNGKYHEEINQPAKLNDLFKDVYQKLDSPRLVIFVPVKCEKYIQNEVELFRKIQEGYRKILNKFASERLLPKVAVIITPVQTVGSVIFSRVEEDENDQPIFYYRKPNSTDPYQPQNSEKPLKYLLRFLLKLYLDNRQASILSRMSDFFGKSKSFKKAVMNFCNFSLDRVEIIQSEDLLKL